MHGRLFSKGLPLFKLNNTLGLGVSLGKHIHYTKHILFSGLMSCNVNVLKTNNKRYQLFDRVS